MTKRVSSFRISVVMYIGRELANEIFVRGNVFFLRDVVRTYIYIFFPYFIDTLFLLCDSKPCTYDVIYMMRLLLQFLFIICNILFLFHTKMP